jgi:hypothetical protein
MKGPSSDQVHVEMKDRLSGAWTHIEDGAVSIFNRTVTCNLRRRKMALADNLGVFRTRFFQSRDVFLRDDENMRRALRIQIFEGIDVLIFVDFLRGHFTANNAAE